MNWYNTCIYHIFVAIKIPEAAAAAGLQDCGRVRIPLAGQVVARRCGTFVVDQTVHLETDRER